MTSKGSPGVVYEIYKGPLNKSIMYIKLTARAIYNLLMFELKKIQTNKYIYFFLFQVLC